MPQAENTLIETLDIHTYLYVYTCIVCKTQENQEELYYGTCKARPKPTRLCRM
jgi:hypothetical protein